MRDYATYIQEAEVATVDGRIVAIGGLCSTEFAGSVLDFSDDLWGFVEVYGDAGAHGYKIARALLSGLKRAGRPVKVQCDADIETAPRLLKALGFKETDQLTPDKREPEKMLKVYEWQK